MLVHSLNTHLNLHLTLLNQICNEMLHFIKCDQLTHLSSFYPHFIILQLLLCAYTYIQVINTYVQYVCMMYIIYQVCIYTNPNPNPQYN